MLHAFSRTELLVGRDGLRKLAESTIAIFGIGGVGSFTAEALARTGVGHLVLVDDDDICITNLNRQLHATMKVIGQTKVDVMRDRLLTINPKMTIDARKVRYTSETSAELLSSDYDYVVDAIDMISSKIDLILACGQLGIPIISCMGAGNKFDATKFEVADIYATSICPLAKVMRKELRKRGVERLKVVYSREQPAPLQETDANCSSHCVCPSKEAAKCLAKRQIPGSLAFVPSVAGMILAGEAVRDLLQR